MYDITVIIPTLNERENIREIICEIDTIFRQNYIRGQILITDDDSSDGTGEIVCGLMEEKPNLFLIIRKTDHGLSQSVVDGFSRADSDIFLVMDSDFSHPPTLIPDLYDGIMEGNDVVIGSRYMKGGKIMNWPIKRHIISYGATILCRAFFPAITDPGGGFFAVRKSVVDGVALKPRGYKMLFEVLGKGKWDSYMEIPYTFFDRTSGASKMNASTVADCVMHLYCMFRHSLAHPESTVWREWKRFLSG